MAYCHLILPCYFDNYSVVFDENWSIVWKEMGSVASGFTGDNMTNKLWTNMPTFRKCATEISTHLQGFKKAITFCWGRLEPDWVCQSLLYWRAMLFSLVHMGLVVWYDAFTWWEKKEVRWSHAVCFSKIGLFAKRSESIFENFRGRQMVRHDTKHSWQMPSKKDQQIQTIKPKT